MMDNILEMFKQIAFLTSVLAGFGITATIELIALNRKNLLTTYTIALFSTSAIIEIVSTYLFISVMGAVYGIGFPKVNEAWTIHFAGGMGLLPFLGLLLFLAGIALIGWLYSKFMGILTLIFSALGFVFIILMMVSMSTS